MATAALVAALPATLVGCAAHSSAAGSAGTDSSASAARPSAASAPAAAPGSPHTTGSPTDVPPVSAAAAAVGLVDVRSAVPDAVLDLRYATTDNVTGVQLYPADARCLVHESIAPGLATAAARLRAAGYRLVFWDCYRPHSVQVTMYHVVPNPDWVAKPGPYSRSHETGRSVDVTVAWSGTDCAGMCLVEMGTGFDDFTPRAHAFATDGVPASAQHNRAVLRDAMTAGGLTVYDGEWWHFDGPGASVRRPVIDVPVD